METCSFCSELAAAFLVLGSEESLKLDHRFVIFHVHDEGQLPVGSTARFRSNVASIFEYLCLHLANAGGSGGDSGDRARSQDWMRIFVS